MLLTTRVPENYEPHPVWGSSDDWHDEVFEALYQHLSNGDVNAVYADEDTLTINVHMPYKPGSLARDLLTSQIIHNLADYSAKWGEGA